MSRVSLQKWIYTILTLLISSNSICSNHSHNFEVNYYMDAYNYISNIEDIGINNGDYYPGDFEDATFFVYDSLVYISEMVDFDKGIEKTKYYQPIYYSELSNQLHNQFDIYNINDNKRVKFIIYFSKVINGYLFADIIKIGPISFAWPDSISKCEKEAIFEKQAHKTYIYNNKTLRYYTSSRYIFMFKLNTHGKMEYVEHIHIQY